MQSEANKQFGLFFIMVLLMGFAHATPMASKELLEKYRESYKDSVDPIKYIFVDSKRNECCSDDPKGKIYMLNITAEEPVNFIYSPEVDHLFKEHFDVMIEDDSIISSPEADYLVLQMSRPHEYSPKSTHCAAGMGEDRAYLISIAKNKVKILNRKFLDCADSYRILHGDGQIGYEVKDHSQGTRNPQSMLYLLQKDGKFVRKANGPYKETP